MLTKEQKAQIARQNGAKSHGPSTQAGKDRSRANGLKHGQRATTLRHLAQPHPAILCNEDSHNFFLLFHDLIKFYRPIGPVAHDIVREIAIARTEITRTQLIKAASWNRSLLGENAKTHNLPESLIPVECAINSALTLARSDAQFDRAIDRLFLRITRLERRLRFIASQFPSYGTETSSCAQEQADYNRTNPESPQPQQSTELNQNELTSDSPDDFPLITDDPSQATREAYEYFFPGRKLIVVDPNPDLDPT